MKSWVTKQKEKYSINMVKRGSKAVVDPVQCLKALRQVVRRAFLFGCPFEPI